MKKTDCQKLDGILPLPQLHWSASEKLRGRHGFYAIYIYIYIYIYIITSTPIYGRVFYIFFLFIYKYEQFDIHLNYVDTTVHQFYSVQFFEFSMSVVSFIQSS